MSDPRTDRPAQPLSSPPGLGHGLQDGGPGAAQLALDPAATERLSAQLAFLMEADRLKTVLRASLLTDGSRRENTGEHSWHIALFAMTLADQAKPGVRIDRVLRMLVLHDLVEIDTGDVPIHSGDGTLHNSAAQQSAEARAADRIFGLLPADQAAEFRALWDEFEAAESDDAQFAKAIDRVQPMLLNLANDGGSWIEYAVTREQVETRVGRKVTPGAPRLWAYLAQRVDDWFAKRPR